MTPMRYRHSHLNLSPWVRAVAGDVSGIKIPRGYAITGLAKTGAGPYTLTLLRPGEGWSETSRDRVLAEHVIGDADTVRTWLLILVDLAAIDEHERTSQRTTVTVDGAGYVRAIEP